MKLKEKIFCTKDGDYRNKIQGSDGKNIELLNELIKEVVAEI